MFDSWTLFCTVSSFCLPKDRHILPLFVGNFFKIFIYYYIQQIGIFTLFRGHLFGEFKITNNVLHDFEIYSAKVVHMKIC